MAAKYYWTGCEKCGEGFPTLEGHENDGKHPTYFDCIDALKERIKRMDDRIRDLEEML